MDEWHCNLFLKIIFLKLVDSCGWEGWRRASGFCSYYSLKTTLLGQGLLCTHHPPSSSSSSRKPRYVPDPLFLGSDHQKTTHPFRNLLWWAWAWSLDSVCSGYFVMREEVRQEQICRKCSFKYLNRVFIKEGPYSMTVQVEGQTPSPSVSPNWTAKTISLCVCVCVILFWLYWSNMQHVEQSTEWGESSDSNPFDIITIGLGRKPLTFFPLLRSDPMEKKVLTFLFCRRAKKETICWPITVNKQFS